MVNVALVFSIFLPLLMFSLFLITSDYRRWYKNMARFYEKGGGGPPGKKKLALAQVPKVFFGLFWQVAILAAAFALYLYFDGNCHFNWFRNFYEDDEVSNINWIRGLLVTLFAGLTFYVMTWWVYLFFEKRRIMLAFFVTMFCLAFSAVVLWAMCTTEQCRPDQISNRNWIAFGLYMVFTAWLFVSWIICLVWWRVLGSKLKKDTPAYRIYEERKSRHYQSKKIERYGDERDSPVLDSLVISGKSNAQLNQGQQHQQQQFGQQKQHSQQQQQQQQQPQLNWDVSNEWTAPR
jgi:hypothetical protein